MDNKIIDNLKNVREILKDQDSWTKGKPARDIVGNPISSISKEATCWCLYGAIIKSSIEKFSPRLDMPGGKIEDDTIDYLNYFLPEYKFRHIVNFNDWVTTKHEDVMKLLDDAIAQGEVILDMNQKGQSTS